MQATLGTEINVGRLEVGVAEHTGGMDLACVREETGVAESVKRRAAGHRSGRKATT